MPVGEHAIVRGLRNAYSNVSITPADALPPGFFHYTSAAGLFGIVTSRILRASNFAYLNDSTEIRYGESVVREVLAGYVSDATGLEKMALVVTLQAVEKITANIAFYLSCFCTESDLLSQWRGYGTSAGRFCIGFSSSALYNETQRLELRPGKVIYARDQQVAKIKPVIDRALVAVREASALSQQEQKECMKGICSELFMRLIWELCFFKHPGFAEEKEWRAVHWLEDRAHMKFEPRGGAIRPFVEMFSGSVGSPLPINEVIVGSTLFGPQSLNSVELLLESYGYAKVSIKESGVPFRDV